MLDLSELTGWQYVLSVVLGKAEDLGHDGASLLVAVLVLRHSAHAATQWNSNKSCFEIRKRPSFCVYVFIYRIDRYTYMDTREPRALKTLTMGGFEQPGFNGQALLSLMASINEWRDQKPPL